MQSARMNNPFAAYHPAVAFTFLAVAIVFSMAAFHPVYVCISLVGAFVSVALTQGVRRMLRSLAIAVPVCIIIAVANMLFISSGSTELFRLFDHAFYLEALLYGLVAGGMFCSMILWFTLYAAIMDSESTAAIMGNALPTVSLMITQVMRLVPQFLRRGAAIGAVQNAMTANGQSIVNDGSSAISRSDKKGTMRQSLRTLSVLMSWGLEDGLDRSDAMRARGYGCGIKRTRYRKQPFVWRDGVVLGVIAALTVVSAVFAVSICSSFSFYPYMDAITWQWGYVLYAILVFIPAFLTIRERLLWQ